MKKNCNVLFLLPFILASFANGGENYVIVHHGANKSITHIKDVDSITIENLDATFKIYADKKCTFGLTGSPWIGPWDGTCSLTEVPGTFDGSMCFKTTVLADTAKDSAWGGWGIHPNEANRINLSHFTTYHIAVRGNCSIELGMADNPGDSLHETYLNLADYGFIPDDGWYELSIPLKDFVNVDLSRVIMPLGIVTPAKDVTDPPDKLKPATVFYVDEIYCTTE